MASVARALSHALWIAHKDLLEFSRNRVMLVMLVVFPLFMLMMTGFIFPGGNTMKNVPVSSVNEDSINGTAGPEGILFVQSLQAVNRQTGAFKLTDVPSAGEARDRITRGDDNGAVIVDANFSLDLAEGRQGRVTILYDQSNPTVSAQLVSFMSRVVDEMASRRAAAAVNRTTGLDANASAALVKPYRVAVQGTVPGNPNYFEFLAPGMMMMVMMFSVMMGLPRAISHEKEVGTFDGILAAPTSRLSIIVGKTISSSVRGIIQGAVVLALALLLFGVTVNGSLAVVMLLLLLAIYSFIGMGITIASVSSDEETAQTIMTALQFPMMFLSGVFFPIQQMPWYMQTLSKALPLTYASQAMRKVIVLGAGPGDILTEVAVLLAFGTAFLLVSIPLFQRAMRR